MKYIYIILLVIIFINSCSSSQRFASKRNASKSTTVRDGETIIGYASYYAHKFHGRKTANGEIFNMNDYTAAHRNLPFNTVLIVTNLENNKSVKVRINDRGPYVAGRILDLSLQAAKHIGLIRSGVAKVKIKILKLGNND